MVKFEFKLKDVVMYKGAPHVVIGKAAYIGQPNFFLIQDIESYEDDGFNFLKGSWQYGRSLKKRR